MATLEQDRYPIDDVPSIERALGRPLDEGEHAMLERQREHGIAEGYTHVKLIVPRPGMTSLGRTTITPVREHPPRNSTPAEVIEALGGRVGRTARDAEINGRCWRRRQIVLGRSGTRPAARRRGAGRPRAAATRSSSRSGDSGSSDGPSSDDGPPPASAGLSPALAPRTRDRVLAALRRARRGLTAADLSGRETIDGLPPIPSRSISRAVAELRADGHAISSRRVRAGRVTVTVYALKREAGPPPRHPHAAELTGGGAA